MAAINSHLVDTWISSFEGIDWLNFRSLGLNALRHLHSVPLRLDMLHAAACCWDPELHVFRFGIQELCPTVEEFQAYLGSHTAMEPVIPPVRANFTKILRDELGVSNGAAQFLVRGNFLNILHLFAEFNPQGDVYNITIQNHRMFALCMCLLGLFLLVPSDSHVSPAIVGVALQIKQRRDVVPLVLAETLMGLDGVRSGRTRVFAGSPLLLQLWLCDKTGLLINPRDSQVFEVRTWARRDWLVQKESEGEWLDFFVSMEEDEVVWRCPWLPLPDMAGVHMGSSWMVLAGLTGFTFYFPRRILRQFGMRQEAPYAIPPDFYLPNFKHSVLEAYRSTWHNREVWAADSFPSLHLPRAYRAWIRKEIETRFGRIVD